MLCIYCQSRPGTTRDHVPSKGLLRKPLPPNLLTVPCCNACNRGYSMDEEYFRLIIVGLLCHSADADQQFDGPLSRSMDRLPGLEDLMFGSLTAASDQVLLDLDYVRVFRIADKIARGLSFAVLGACYPAHEPYSIDFSEVDSPSAVQTFGPDFTYSIGDTDGSRVEFTLYDSVRFEATRHN